MTNSAAASRPTPTAIAKSRLLYEVSQNPVLLKRRASTRARTAPGGSSRLSRRAMACLRLRTDATCSRHDAHPTRCALISDRSLGASSSSTYGESNSLVCSQFIALTDPPLPLRFSRGVLTDGRGHGRSASARYRSESRRSRKSPRTGSPKGRRVEAPRVALSGGDPGPPRVREPQGARPLLREL